MGEIMKAWRLDVGGTRLAAFLFNGWKLCLDIDWGLRGFIDIVEDNEFKACHAVGLRRFITLQIGSVGLGIHWTKRLQKSKETLAERQAIDQHTRFLVRRGA